MIFHFFFFPQHSSKVKQKKEDSLIHSLCVNTFLFLLQ